MPGSKFRVEVTENGFILEIYVPEGKKSNEKVEKYVCMTKTALFQTISEYLAEKGVDKA